MTHGEPCQREAIFWVHWPGKSLQMCADCAVRAQNIAHFMGFRLSINAIDQLPLPVISPRPRRIVRSSDE